MAQSHRWLFVEVYLEVATILIINMFWSSEGSGDSSLSISRVSIFQPFGPWDGGPGGGLEATDHPNILRLLEIFEDAASSAFFSAKAAIFQRPSIWWFGARRAGVVSHLPSAKATN